MGGSKNSYSYSFGSGNLGISFVYAHILREVESLLDFMYNTFFKYGKDGSASFT